MEHIRDAKIDVDRLDDIGAKEGKEEDGRERWHEPWVCESDAMRDW